MGAEVTLLTSQAAQLQCSLSKAHEEQQELSQRTHTQHMQDAAIISEQQAKLAALQANIADLKTTAAAAEHQHHASLLLVIGEKEAEQRQATEHQTELQRELKHSCEERAVIHMQLDLANKELYKKQQTAEAALQELKEILMQKDDELDVCSSEAAALQQQLYHADSKIESLVLTLGEQSIELDNKSMPIIISSMHDKLHGSGLLYTANFTIWQFGCLDISSAVRASAAIFAAMRSTATARIRLFILQCMAYMKQFCSSSMCTDVKLPCSLRYCVQQCCCSKFRTMPPSLQQSHPLGAHPMQYAIL